MRLAVARDEGLDEELVGELRDHRASSALTEAQKAAIDLADVLMTQPGALPEELRERLERHFTRDQVLELTLDVMKWNYQKAAVVLGVDVEVAAGELTDLVFDAEGHWVRPS